MALKPKEAAFLAAYLKTSNATQAAIEIGHKPSSAASMGHWYLRKSEIQAAIAKNQNKADAKAEEWTREVTALAKSNIVDAFKPDLSMKSLHEMPEHMQKAIQSIEVTDHMDMGSTGTMEVVRRNSKFKLWSKTEALKLWGQYLKVIGNDSESGPTQNITINVGIANAK